MPRLVFDFTSLQGGPALRRIFAEPVEVVRAERVPEVRPALERVAEGVAGGLWAAGYLAYEAAPAFDPAFRVRGGGRMDLMWFGLFEGCREGEVAGFRPPRGPSDPRHPVDPHETDVAPYEPLSGAHAPSDPRDPLDPHEGPGEWELEITREDFDRQIGRIHRAIEAGDTYQVNHTARMRAPFSGSPRRLYDRLRAAQGRGYHALLELDGRTIVSASPELFFRIRGRDVTTRPMKGTSPRGRWLEEDDALAARLRESEKEQAENRMIVDLLRNDLGRVCEIGSVRVPEVFAIERYRTVLQMTSTVTGRLPEGAGFVEVLDALFPCGSVTGAPKIRTMEIIAELERSAREVYCGAVGWVEGGGGSAVFSVPIRTLWIDEAAGEAVYGAGSGVTWSSTADGEFAELRDKARILSERWPTFDLLETMLLEDGRIRRLERHLERMERSARYFQRPFPGARIRGELAAAAARCPSGAWKVRMTLSAGERLRLDVTPETRLRPDATPETPAPRGDPADPDRPGAADRGTPRRGAPARPVALADAPVDSSNRFLYHKTTHREVYDARLRAHPGVEDVLLWNEEGRITEFTRGNVVARVAGRLVTPPRSAGLLAGCFRQELLEGGRVAEEDVSVADLEGVEEMWLINSVRGWVPVVLEPGAARAGAREPGSGESGPGRGGPGTGERGDGERGDGERGRGPGGRTRPGTPA